MPYVKDTLVRMLPERQQVLIGQLDRLVIDLQAHEQVGTSCDTRQQTDTWLGPIKSMREGTEAEQTETVTQSHRRGDAE